MKILCPGFGAGFYLGGDRNEYLSNLLYARVRMQEIEAEAKMSLFLWECKFWRVTIAVTGYPRPDFAGERYLRFGRVYLFLDRDHL